MLLKNKDNGSSLHQQASVVQNRPRQKPDMANPGYTFATWVGVALVVISLVLVMAVWSARERRETLQSPTAAAQHSSVILIHEVERLPPLAWKAVPFSLAHGGIVNIDVQVVRGNPVDVFLTTADQIDDGKKGEWTNLKIYGDIKATRTKTFSRGVQLARGGFYLVVRDMTVAIPSSPPSDISVKVRLEQ